MTTIVIHGTKLIAGAQHTPWWYASWHPGGFLDALAQGMIHADGWHDVWAVNGEPVSEIAALNPRWSPWTGRMGQVSVHEGHFIWSGADMGVARDAGADALAHYLNTICDLTAEPIRIIAYSHGCNVVKGASTSAKLNRSVFIDAAVFLACPHFYAHSGGEDVFTYRLAPERFGRILNLYSDRDTVQVGFADAVTGPAGARWQDWIPPHSARTDQDPHAAYVYEDVPLTLDPSVGGVRAHTVIHGAAAGLIAGLWLNGNGTMDTVYDAFGGRLPVIAPEDDGA